MVGKSRGGSKALRAALLSTVALGFAVPAQAAETKDIESLEQQMQMLMRELQELKAKQQQQEQKIEAQTEQIEAQEEQLKGQDERLETQEEKVTVAPAQAVTGGDKPGSFKLPGSNTSVKIGGYVKGDAIYDVNSDTGDSFAASAIPADGTDEEEGSFRAHARQTRVNLTTWTPIGDLGEVKTYIEGDFFGAGGNELFTNGTAFRIRHAYGDFGYGDFNLLVGQTWTNFMPLASYPETIDFFGPAGIPFIRQGQVRLTYNGIENVAVSFSAENSELTARDGEFVDSNDIRSEAGDLQFGVDTIPDFTAAVEYDRAGYNLKVAGVARLLETEKSDVATNPTGSDEQEFGWGAFIGGVAPVPFFGADDSVNANFTYGDGVGRYLINGFGQDAFVDPVTGDLDSIEAWGVTGGYTHYWFNTLRSNFIYGRYEVDDTFGLEDTETLQTVHANLIWSPIDRINLGVEWIYGMREFEDDDLDNDAQRVQFGAQVFF